MSNPRKPVRKYLVDADAFFSQRINPELRSYHDTNSTLCQATISDLMEAYSLGRKSVLSVGSKVGHEEVWFYRAGATGLSHRESGRAGASACCLLRARLSCQHLNRPLLGNLNYPNITVHQMHNVQCKQRLDSL